MKISRSRHIRGAGSRPTIRVRIVSSASIDNLAVGSTAFPTQTIISLPVHTAVCKCRASGALVVLVAVQLSALGSYLPPVLKSWQMGLQNVPTPDNHFTAGPHCRVIDSGIGRVVGYW